MKVYPSFVNVWNEGDRTNSDLVSIREYYCIESLDIKAFEVLYELRTVKPVSEMSDDLKNKIAIYVYDKLRSTST